MKTRQLFIKGKMMMMVVNDPDFPQGNEGGDLDKTETMYTNERMGGCGLDWTIYLWSSFGGWLVKLGSDLFFSERAEPLKRFISNK